MRMTLTFTDEDGTVREEEIDERLSSSPFVIMVKQGNDSQPVVESYEPLTIDNHPDTLREIGGRIVQFAEGK